MAAPVSMRKVRREHPWICWWIGQVPLVVASVWPGESRVGSSPVSGLVRVGLGAFVCVIQTSGDTSKVDLWL